MRLTNKELEVIISTFKEIFKSGKIYLFGSRVDDNKKGGDIDLYIQTKEIDNLTEKKINFLVNLKQKIGEQKIDVVISRDKNRSIEKIAIKEGIELDSKKLKIQKQLKESNKHKIRIEKYYNKIKNILPLSASKYEKLNDEIEIIDGYLFRFAKLQDTIGQKLFRMVVSEFVEDIEKLTFIDILNQLEKIGILENIQIWQRLRDIRNNISHQYDDESYEMAEAINSIFSYKDDIIDILAKIENFYQERKKISLTT